MNDSVIPRQPNAISTKTVTRLIGMAQKSLSKLVQSEPVSGGLVFVDKEQLEGVKRFVDRAMEAAEALQSGIDDNALSDAQVAVIKERVGQDTLLDYAVVGRYIILKLQSASLGDVCWTSIAMTDSGRTEGFVSDSLDGALLCALCAGFDQVEAAPYIAKMLGISADLAA